MSKKEENKKGIKIWFKTFKKSIKQENIFKFIIIIASIAIIVSSFLPYILF